MCQVLCGVPAESCPSYREKELAILGTMPVENRISTEGGRGSSSGAVHSPGGGGTVGRWVLLFLPSLPSPAFVIAGLIVLPFWHSLIWGPRATVEAGLFRWDKKSCSRKK